MAYGRSHAIDALSVLAVYRLQGATHSVRTRRHDYQVDVIGHQAVREDTQAFASPIGVQQVQIGLWIAGNMEHAFAMIAPLRDMMWNAREDGSAVSRHIMKVTVLLRQVL